MKLRDYSKNVQDINVLIKRWLGSLVNRRSLWSLLCILVVALTVHAGWVVCLSQRELEQQAEVQVESIAASSVPNELDDKIVHALNIVSPLAENLTMNRTGVS